VTGDDVNRLLIFLESEDARRKLEAGFCTIARDGATRVLQALGEEAMFLGNGPLPSAPYAAAGRLMTLRPDTDNSLLLRLDVAGLTWFAAPPIQPISDGNAVAEVTEQQFEDMRLAASRPTGGVSGLAERIMQTPYAPPAGQDLLRSVVETVKREYGFTCGLIGKKLAPEELRVAVIRPKPLGGSFHVNNCLALCPEADAAFAAGHFTVRDNGRIIVDKFRIDPALLAAINGTGRLLWPDNPALRPTPDNLDYHRRFVFGLN
jgi:hypothetical protein